VADLFKEILPSILQTKVDVLDNEKDYPPFIVNKALSFHLDCVMAANVMNQYSHLDPRLQYQYYINTLRGYKRPFQKWQKKEVIEDLDAVKEYFNYSDRKAQEALKLLSAADVLEIKNKIKKGGLNNDKPKRVHRG
jgi:hypothetical protein